MKSTHKNSCRKKDSNSNSTKLKFTFFSPSLGKHISTLLIIFLPALFSNCNSMHGGESLLESTIPISLRSPEPLSANDNIDIFTFNDNRLMQLDSYQRISYNSTGTIKLRSQNGPKKIFAYRNAHTLRQDWYSLNSYWGLEDIRTELKDERSDMFTMSGESEAVAGSSNISKINMQPYVSEILLRSIRCDFTGKSYQGQKLRNVVVYLTNVNCSCPLIYDEPLNPSTFVNMGGLDDDIFREFKEPELIMRDINSTIGQDPIRTNISLYCYPNTCKEEGPGTPFTRLVIEGRLNGQTCWWPININRKSDCKDPGIHRNCRYIYDLTLRTKGSVGPDDPIEIEDIDIEMNIESWNEKDNYSVEF